ncbi:signal peptidase I [bacterium]|nr:MAG: signal peptidase I [bacterium]
MLVFSSFWFHLLVVASLLAARYVLTVRLKPSSEAMRVRINDARETCDSVSVTLFALFFLIQPFVAQAYWIPTGSMENSLPINTRILASPLAPKVVPVRSGEVLVFNAPTKALQLSNGQEGEVWVKRCIGTPGQVIEIKKNVLWRDGKIVAEPYAIWSSPGAFPITYDMKLVGNAVYSRVYDSMGIAGLWTQAEVMAPDQNAITAAASGPVPSNKFLMLGDHRNASLDGHVWGFLNKDAIVGRAFVSFWPPRQIGTIGR